MKCFACFVILCALFAGCNDSSSPETETPAPVTTIVVTNMTGYAPKQLVRLTLTPVGGGSAVAKEFVVNTTDNSAPVTLPIPAAGTYRVEIFAADGQSMWWDSIALALPGTTYLRVVNGSSPVIFWGECSGLAHSGTTMTP